MKIKITSVMRKITSSLLLLFFYGNLCSQNDNGTIDAPGDIAIVAFNKVSSPTSKSDYAFLLLDDCLNGTAIVFDDEEWTGAGFASTTSEGANTWTNNTGSTISAGTIIQVSSGNNLPTVNIGSVTESDAGFNLAAGDQIYAYIGTRSSVTTFLAFYGEDNTIITSPPETATLSGTSLTNGATATVTSNLGYYSGSTTCNSSLADCAAMINNPANWTPGAFVFPTGVATSFNGSAFVSATTWTGATNTDWNTATNWNSGSVPTSSDNVIIANVANKPIISSTTGAVTNDLTINSGATLTINSGGSLIVSGTPSGSVTYKRTLTANWHLVSSPVNGETVQNLTSNHSFPTQSGSTITLAPYNNNGTAWNYYTNSTNANITPGSGLSAKLGAISDLSFTGTINTTNVPYSITQGTANNFNLVGNPFTSYINLGTFFTDNNGKFSEATIWMWNQATSSYDLKMSGTHASFQIAPGQGFFVSAGSNTSINFNTANQSHQTNTFQRSSRNEVTLAIQNKSGKSKSTTIYYIEGTTKGFDNGFDGTMFGSANRFSLYSQLVTDNQGKNYAIQSLPIKEMDKVAIPIGLRAYAGKEIEFSSSNNLPNDVRVYLEDRANNKFIDITNDTYKITPKDDINGIGRFYLRTSKHNLDAPIVSSIEDVSIYKSAPNTLNVVGLQSKNATMNVFSLLGKRVSQKQFTSNGFSSVEIPTLATGVYIIELNSELGKTSKKIILE